MKIELVRSYINKIVEDNSHMIEIEDVIENLLSLLTILLPGRFKCISSLTNDYIMSKMYSAVNGFSKIIEQSNQKINSEQFEEDFFDLFEYIELDIAAALRNDPAAKSASEVILSYPGILAVATYRIAHILHKQEITILPRIITEWAHEKTGIDIHFGAQIGKSFFIDHGSGVVIGETTIIGDNVTIYQGVTLGSKNFPLDDAGNVIKGLKRHPTIGSHVTIYANATILGGDTIIGNNVTIAGNLFVTKSIEDNSIALSNGVIKKKK